MHKNELRKKFQTQSLCKQNFTSLKLTKQKEHSKAGLRESLERSKLKSKGNFQDWLIFKAQNQKSNEKRNWRLQNWPWVALIYSKIPLKYPTLWYHRNIYLVLRS